MSFKRILLASVASAALLAGFGVQGVSYAAQIPVANSYNDLLDPVPDAQTRLVADDLRYERTKDVEVAQLFIQQSHHHHHHHHYRDRSWYLANGYIWSGSGWIIRPRGHHHHHHHQYHHHYN
jgi:hypothetical protein